MFIKLQEDEIYYVCVNFSLVKKIYSTDSNIRIVWIDDLTTIIANNPYNRKAIYAKLEIEL